MKKCTIIGGGILGAMASYRLAKSGIDVTLIDAPDSGKATTAAAGIICPWLSQRRNKSWFHLAKEGAKFYPQLVDELIKDGESDTGYEEVGALILKSDTNKLMQTYERGIKQLVTSPEMGKLTLLSNEETKEAFPLVQSDLSSIHVSGAARVDGRSINQALLNAARKYGAKLISGWATILQQNNRITGVKVDDQMLEADTIICTTGAWMNETLEPLGIQFKARPQRGQILHLTPPNKNINHWPVVMSYNNLSIVPFTNRLIIGATHENNAGFSAHLTAGGIQEILNKAINVMPHLADWPLLDARVGLRPFTPDSMPVIGRVPGFENLLLANGLGASGLTTGPFIGEQLAKLVLNSNLEIELAHYDIHVALEN